MDDKVLEWRERGVDCEVLRRTNRAGYKAGALKEVRWAGNAVAQVALPHLQRNVKVPACCPAMLLLPFWRVPSGSLLTAVWLCCTLLCSFLYVHMLAGTREAVTV